MGAELRDADGATHEGLTRLIGQKLTQLPEYASLLQAVYDAQRDGAHPQELHTINRVYVSGPAPGPGARVITGQLLFRPQQVSVICVHALSFFVFDTTAPAAGTSVGAALRSDVDAQIDYQCGGGEGSQGPEVIGVFSAGALGAGPGGQLLAAVRGQVVAEPALIMLPDVRLYMRREHQVPFVQDESAVCGVRFERSQLVGEDDTAVLSVVYSTAPAGVYPYR